MYNSFKEIAVTEKKKLSYLIVIFQSQVVLMKSMHLPVINVILLICKVAGFVYESFQNKSSNLGFLLSQNEFTKRIFQKQTYESNPRYKSLRFRFTNPDLRIWNLRICKDSDSRISIFKNLFCAIVLRIRKDLLDS